MTKKIILIMTLLAGISCNNTKQETVGYNAIDKNLKNELLQIKNNLITLVLKNDIKQLKLIVSSDFIESNNIDLDLFVKDLDRLFRNESFDIKDQYYTKIISGSSKSNITILTGTSDNSFIINKLRYHGNEIYNMFLVGNGHKFANLLFLSFCKFDNKWKINYIYAGNYSVNGMNVPRLYKASIDSIKNNEQISATVYSLTLLSILRPAPFIQYANEDKFKSSSESIINNSNKIFPFPMNFDNIQILGIEIKILKDLGLFPVFNYVTNKTFKSREFNDEQKKLIKFINNKFPDLKFNFPEVVLRSFNEIPKEKTKNYKILNTKVRL